MKKDYAVDISMNFLSLGKQELGFEMFHLNCLGYWAQVGWSFLDVARGSFIMIRVNIPWKNKVNSLAFFQNFKGQPCR